MNDAPMILSSLTEVQRTEAMERFTLLRPALEEGTSQAEIARLHHLPLRSVQRWMKQYRQHGLVGLAKKERKDRGTRRGLPPEVVRLIEGLALLSSLGKSYLPLFSEVSESRTSSPPLACYDLLQKKDMKARREGICTYEDKRPRFRRAWRSASMPLLV